MMQASSPSVQQYLELEGDIPLDLPNGSYISLTRTAPLKVFSLGFQPAKTIPEIPSWFLRKYCSSLPFTVLEPFAGSGTTLIESLRFGANAIWLDYHPLSQLICRVKTTEICIPRALEAGHAVLRKAKAARPVPPSISFSNKDFWFQLPVQEALELLRKHIQLSDRDVQPLLWLVFSVVVRKMSNMNGSMILAARRSNFEEVPKRSVGDVYACFNSYLLKYAEALEEWHREIGSGFKLAKELEINDAMQIVGGWKCDAVITSPPYINAIDYVWASKFELHWLGFVRDNQERLDLYAKEIGTERIPGREFRELGHLGIDRIDRIIEDIYTGRRYKASKGQNELRARVVYKYFRDMRTHFEGCFSHVRPGGYYCFSIGDLSRICGVVVPTAQLLVEIAKSAGFRNVFEFHLLLKNRKLNMPRNVEWAGTIPHDTTVVMERPLL